MPDAIHITTNEMLHADAAFAILSFMIRLRHFFSLPMLLAMPLKGALFAMLHDAAFRCFSPRCFSACCFDAL